MRKNLEKGLLFFGVLSLVCFVLLLSFHVFVYNSVFYDWQYRSNGIYDTLGYDTTWDATHELWNYMQHDGEFYSGFYSEQDRLHMVDVRVILDRVQWLFFGSAMLLLVVLFLSYYRLDFWLFISRLSLYSGIGLFGFVLFSAVLALFFEKSFVLFHELFFSNDLWLMDPVVDKLVVLYPGVFFQTIFVAMILVSLLLGFVLVLLGYSIRMRKHI